MPRDDEFYRYLSTTKCCSCNGTGRLPNFTLHQRGHTIECYKCGGTGRIEEPRLDPNQVLDDGNTFFHQSVEKGTLKIVQICVEEGADINKKNKDGWTALHLAAHRGSADIVKYLLAAGADCAAVTAKGETARSIASRNWFNHSVTLLISKAFLQRAEQEPQRDEESKRILEEETIWAQEQQRLEKEAAERLGTQQAEERRKTMAEQWRHHKEEVKRQKEEAKRLTKKKREFETQRKRKDLGLCIYCGKPLSFFQRLCFRERHISCSAFEW